MQPPLLDAKDLLIRRWGEMGGYWGINRTMAEIHALLFVSGETLCTDDVMARLHISRGNASMNLRGLVDWGLISRVHKLGDRKEYFSADTDIWHMFETIVRERTRREVEPIAACIDRCREMVAAKPDGAEPAAEDERKHFLRRVDELKAFLSTMSMLFELFVQLGSDGIEQLQQLLGATHAAEINGASRSKLKPARGPRHSGNGNGNGRAVTTRTRRRPR
jgi:HTH-type transcriptional regulator, glycine betaine synthesis regulator